MEGAVETLPKVESIDNELQLARFSRHQPRVKAYSSSWLDLRVFYVRISNFQVDNLTPEFLTLNHIPLSPDTLFEVNGVRCSGHSEGVSSSLRRDRADKKSEEATFVTTDIIRLTGSVKFEVYDKEDLILSGILEMANCNGLLGESKGNAKKWNMSCMSKLGVGFLKGKHLTGAETTSPIIDVYVAGSFSGNPIILTRTLHLSSRKKQSWKSMLDVIPESETPESNEDQFPEYDLQILLLLALDVAYAKSEDRQLERGAESIVSHSCIHDQILEQKRRPGLKVYSVTPQVYDISGAAKPLHRKGRALLGVSELSDQQKSAKQPIRIYLNYDAVGHSPDRDCQKVGDIVKLGEPPVTSSFLGSPSCNPHDNPPISGDCWYNCTLDDISGEDKRHRLHKALGQTADWFRRALAVEPVKGNLRLSGYSACGQDGGVQLPREYVEEGIPNADLVLLVTTRPTTGNTLAWAVACERDQWGRAIAGHVNVAPRHLTAEAETLLSATLIHEVMHVLGFDPHAFAHFRDERKRRRSRVTEQVLDERLGRTVTRVVLPRVVMHSRYHYGAFSENFTGLELEDGGGRGTSGSHWEKRLLMNEIMTGSVDTRSVVSKMTLALLEDSGWYQANYSMADRLDWGRNQGNDFVTSPCNLWKGAYHCNTTQLSGCTYNREAEGYCPIVSYSGDLPQWARYFPQPNKGGQSSLADYCTYFVAYSDGSCTDTNSARAPDRMLGEVRGTNSRCMASSLVRTGFVRGSMTQGNGCYQHRCINNSLEVAVDGMWKVCPEAGGPVQFPGFNGELVCPAYHELCSKDSVSVSGKCPNTCNFNGDCVDGKCFCFLGYHGHDCSKRSCPNNCSGHGRCLSSGLCECGNGYTGIDCSTAICDEQCSLHGGVCDNGICEFRCSDYAGYSCQNSSRLLSSLSVCKNVLQRDMTGQHCAPSEPSILQQLEEVVVMPNYHRLFPGGARKLFNIFGGSYCDAAAKQLACWISIQKCDQDGDNRLRVCHSACQSYNLACGASLDCSDQTLFSSEEEGEGQCTGSGEIKLSWFNRLRSNLFVSNSTSKGGTSSVK